MNLRTQCASPYRTRRIAIPEQKVDIQMLLRGHENRMSSRDESGAG